MNPLLFPRCIADGRFQVRHASARGYDPPERIRGPMFHFHLAENGTTVRTEIIAGVTTFLSMVYILAVYPSVMGEIGIPAGGAVIAAVVASFIGTVLMGLVGKYPFGLAPGVGIVPFFAFSVVLGMGIS